MYIKMMPHGASDKDTANSQSCCHLLLKKGSLQGHMVTQSLHWLDFPDLISWLHASRGRLQGCQSFRGNAWPQMHVWMWTPEIKALSDWHGSHHMVPRAPAPPPSACFSLQPSAGLGFFWKSQGGSCSSLSSFLFLAGLLWLREWLFEIE